MRVLDAMTTDVITTAATESLKEAAAKMVNARVSGLPVVDDDGRLVGIITEADFIQQQAERDGGRMRLLGALFEQRTALDAPVAVGEVMTTDPVVITEEALLSEAARLMAGKGVKRLPVVDVDGHVTGIVSRADIVAAFTRPDEIIIDDISEDIVKRILFLDPADISVDVEAGVVTLRGEFERQSDTRLLEELARRLEGVVRVDNQLTWRVAEASKAGRIP